MGAKEAPYSITLNRQLHSHGVTNTREKEEKKSCQDKIRAPWFVSQPVPFSNIFLCCRQK